jgi:alkylation response protein AidB-like acyl-CoA dehydrogenase
MNFDYSDEHKQLQDEARRFLADRCRPSAARAVLDDASSSFDRHVWSGIAELGWLGASIPETHGGLGLGYVGLCALAEELGRAIAPVPFASTLYFFAEALLLAGSAAQQTRWLPRIAAGKLIGCFATSEGPGPTGGRPLTVEAKADRLDGTRLDGSRLDGTKIPVTDGDVADAAIVLAADSGAPSLFIVDLAQSAVQRTTVESLDGTRGLASLHFTGAHAERLGAKGDGLRLVDRVLQRAAVMLAFEQIGGADRCLEAARDYALQRYAFGRPIGGYQAIKHRLAEMYVRNELARSNAYYAAWALAADAPELPVAAASARIAAGDAFSFAARENIQIHGGVGFTWEADAHLYFRRARQLSLVAGSAAWWSEYLVSAITAPASTAAASAAPPPAAAAMTG